ncbi:hypothetical protein ACOSP7_020069 [Xanthoceras sorbifolium]
MMKYVKPLQLYQEYKQAYLTLPCSCVHLIGLHVDNKYVRSAFSYHFIRGTNIIEAEPQGQWPRRTNNIADKLQELIKEHRPMGLVVTIPDIKLMDIHNGVDPKVFIDDMCKTGKFEGVKYTYWNMAFMSKDAELSVCFLGPGKMSLNPESFTQDELLSKELPPQSPQTIRRKKYEFWTQYSSCLVLKGLIDYGNLCDGERERERHDLLI